MPSAAPPSGWTERFAAVFPGAPAPRLCRAPGRVNLLGEHVDYNGLPVLPMTLDRAITIAYAPAEDNAVSMRSVESVYEPGRFMNQREIPPSPGHWTNYVKAAFQGLNDDLCPRDFPGMRLLVAGNIPQAAGLSSSTALVVAAALAYLDVLDRRPRSQADRLELAGLLAGAEHYVGTQGGGMDQAIILTGAAGAACLIHFEPLATEQAPFFTDHRIVIANSMVKAEKTGAALHRYNAGPALCRLITALVNRELAEAGDAPVEKLADLWYGLRPRTDAEARDLFERAMPRQRVTLSEAAARLGLAPGEVRRRYVGELPEPPGGFPLRARARHQRTEHARVRHGATLLRAGDAEGFGGLMDASHASCRDDFDVSCPELDELVETARAHGAVGARLTGSGLGGCTANLVPAGQVASFCEGVERDYHRGRLQLPAATNGAARIVVANPSGPADYLACGASVGRE